MMQVLFDAKDDNVNIAFIRDDAFDVFDTDADACTGSEVVSSMDGRTNRAVFRMSGAISKIRS